jgi:hypothetical protein
VNRPHALQRGIVKLDAGRECDRCGVANTCNFRDLAGAQNAFAEQKSRRQFGILARSAYGNGNVSLADTDLQRLFDGDQILILDGRDLSRLPANGNGENAADRHVYPLINPDG